jgi:hypothetical protein
MKTPKPTSSYLLVLLLAGFVPYSAWGQAASTGKAVTESKSTPAKKSDVAPLTLADDAPTKYTVVKGDTLWDISGKFLKEPWRWPEIWNMNREQIKDPHWIYPGDVITLSFDSNGKPMLSLLSGGGTKQGLSGGTVTLSPQVRTQPLTQAIPSIPSRIIGPFLTMPLVIEEDELLNSPRIIAAEDNRVIIGAGNTAYAAGITPNMGTRWQVYRPGSALIDPESREVLGYEATFLGDAKVTRFGEGATVQIIRSTQEINKGDRLTATAEGLIPSYSPHAPDKALKGAVVSVVGGVNESAQYSVVALSLGRREGVEVGHVLATLRMGETVDTREGGFSFKSLLPNRLSGANAAGQIPSEIKLPDERNGLIFVFRVFEKVSYGLVMSSRLPVKVGDIVQTP